MSVQSSSGSLEGPPSWSQLSTSPTPGSAAAVRSLLNHTPPSGRPREGKRRRARSRTSLPRSRAAAPRPPPLSPGPGRGVLAARWTRGRRARGGGALAAGGGSRVAEESVKGPRAGGDGARRAESPGSRSRSCEGGRPPPRRQPLSAPFARTLSTLNLLASGLWWAFPPVGAFIPEPPPLPSAHSSHRGGPSAVRSAARDPEDAPCWQGLCPEG